MFDRFDLRGGIIYGILAALFFTVMGFFVKLLDADVPISLILFFRFGISLIVLLPFIIKDFKSIIVVSHPWTFMVRTLMNLLAIGCFFQALKYSSFIDVLVLVNTTPFFVPIVAKILFGSKTHTTVWIGISLGFVGVTFILNPDAGVFHLSSLLALISGVLGAIGITLVRALSKTRSIKQILFYNFFLATVLTAPMSSFSWQKLSPVSYYLLILIGICGALYQLCSTLSYAKIPVRISSSFMFLCILFGSLMDWAILGLIPDRESLIGMGLVILGGLWILYFGRRHIFSNKL